jgi:hypothetical protein
LPTLKPQVPFNIQDHILYEDNHLIAIHKPSGYLVQGDDTGDAPLSELVKDFLKERDQKPGNVFCGVIHRIDRPVSGVVVLAKTSKALSKMNELFREDAIKKTYRALVNGVPEIEQQELRSFLRKNDNCLDNSFYSGFDSDGEGGGLVDRECGENRVGDWYFAFYCGSDYCGSRYILSRINLFSSSSF